jgi:hypothetical protein
MGDVLGDRPRIFHEYSNMGGHSSIRGFIRGWWVGLKVSENYPTADKELCHA